MATDIDAMLSQLSPEERARWQQQFAPQMQLPPGAPMPQKPEDWRAAMAPPAPPQQMLALNDAPSGQATDAPAGPTRAMMMSAITAKLGKVPTAPEPDKGAAHGDVAHSPPSDERFGAVRAAMAMPPVAAATEDPAAGATFNDPNARYNMIGVDTRSDGPTRTVKVSNGGRTPHSWTEQVQEGTRLNPETLSQYEMANKEGRDAIDKEQALDEHRVGYNQQFLQAKARYDEGYEANMAAMRARQQAEIDRHMGQLRTLQEEARKDPTESFYEDGGMGLRVSHSIASFLGAIGAAISHRPDAIPQMIDSQIQRHFDAQREGVKNKQNFIGELKAKFGDEKMAESAAKIAYYEKAKAQLDYMSSDLDDQAVQVRAQKLRATFDAGVADQHKAFDLAAANKVARVQNDVNQPAQYATVGGEGSGAGKYDKISPKEYWEQRKALSEAYEKAGVPATAEVLRNVQRSFDVFGTGDIKGIGPFDKHLQDDVVGEEGRINRRRFAEVRSAAIREMSGGAVSPDEAARNKEFMEGMQTPAEVRDFLQARQAQLSAKQRNLSRGFDRRVIHDYLRDGGTVTDIAPNKPMAPTVKRAKGVE